MKRDWRPISEFNLKDYEVCHLGHYESDGCVAYATIGWFRRNQISGNGFCTGEGEWLIPQPTHFMPLEIVSPPLPDDPIRKRALDLLTLFESCVVGLVSAEYAEGYRDALKQLLERDDDEA